MKRLLLIAILTISTAPLSAHGQRPNATKLKANAQKVVEIVRGDRLKIQTYCQISDLSDQIDEEVNLVKAEELSKAIGKLEEKLGPEYIALRSVLKNIDPDSSDGREIHSMLRALEALCMISNGTTTGNGLHHSMLAQSLE